MGDLIKCGHNNAEHKDCFARTKYGECECLIDCNFKGDGCHFYKNKYTKNTAKGVNKHE